MAINNADTKPESNPHKPHHHPHQHQPMDDAAVHNLKSLNALLLKETTEKRKQVDSLTQSNTYLESEFNRSVMENESLQSEMNSTTELAAALEIEKGLAFVFMAAHVSRVGEEMNKVLVEKSEIEKEKRELELAIEDLNRRVGQLVIEIDEQRAVSVRVGDERDAIRAQLNARVQEVSELILKVTKAEENEARVVKEVTELKGKCDRLVAENEASVRRIDTVTKEKDGLQTSLVESNGLVEELQGNIAKLVEQNKAIEDEKIALDGKSSELQDAVDELKKLVERMRVEEQTLLEKFAVLEEKYAASLKAEVERKTEVDALVEEKKESERLIEHLGKEKSLVGKELEDAVKELEQQKLSYERLVGEKTELESAKMQVESEVVKMSGELHALKDVVASLETASVSQMEKVKELEVESGSYKSSFEQAAMERDEALKQLDEEKTITSDYKQMVARMEKEVEDLKEVLANITTENEKHVGEKKQLEDRCTGLVKEVADLEAKLAETRMELDGKVGAAEANSNKVLSILKKTVMVCDGNSDDVDHENGVEEGIKEHVAGIEAIKRACKDKESRLEEIKVQLELVKNSAAEARKEKSFWTMVSSATTLLAAAASLAFVARNH